MPVTVFGFIEGFTDAAQDDCNQRQLQTLPKVGAYLTQELFSFVPQHRSNAYYGSHIHFAVGNKDLYCLEREWVEEFESLLTRLHWYRAEVILTWSKERYVWMSDFSHEAPSDMTNKIAGRSRFENAWDLKEIPWDS